jgi:hypothetical protein
MSEHFILVLHNNVYEKGDRIKHHGSMSSTPIAQYNTHGATCNSYNTDMITPAELEHSQEETAKTNSFQEARIA